MYFRMAFSRAFDFSANRKKTETLKELEWWRLRMAIITPLVQIKSGDFPISEG